MVSIKNPAIQSKVDALLLDDLGRFSLPVGEGYKVDWSDCVPEGGGTDYEGCYIGSASDVTVYDALNNLIGGGWVDHITDASGKLYSFWTIFDKAGEETHGHGGGHGEGFGIPIHIWLKLDEKDKEYLAATHQGWSQDANLLPYRRKVVTKKVRVGLDRLQKILLKGTPAVPGFDSKLYEATAKKIGRLANNFLKNKLMDPNISTDTWELRTQLDELGQNTDTTSLGKLRVAMSALEELEGEVRHAAIAINNKVSRRGFFSRLFR